MKILVLGSSGMVGHVVALYLNENGYQVVGYDNESLQEINTILGNITDFEKIEATIKDVMPDAIVNCTAVINNDAEQDKCNAILVNSYLPHFLEKVTQNTKTYVIHRSTDCIFSGREGCYTLSSLPDAVSFYARTKVVGELDNNKDITIRTSLVGPELNGDNRGLLGWFASQKSEIQGYKSAIWTGITTLEFAKEVEMLIKNRENGVFQCVPSFSISKYELLLLFNQYVNEDVAIKPVATTMTDKSLAQVLPSCIDRIPTYEDMIKELWEWMRYYPHLYKQYI